jgi:hypothetical protein
MVIAKKYACWLKNVGCNKLVTKEPLTNIGLRWQILLLELPSD